MWSAALDIILTTLRYLAPATLLTLFWTQQSFLFKFLKHIDSALRSIIFSSEEQKKEVLQWLAEAGPVTVEHLDTVWRHGWILCGVLDGRLPGACAGHSPTRLSLKHAQTIAEHYLGVEPVFTQQELESNDSLSKHQEWKLATYLDRVRQAMNKLTPPVSKPNSQRTSPETTQFILDYVAGGAGLSAAQVNNVMYFKIYPTAQQSMDPGEITILIRGPRDTYGMIVIPPVLGKAQLIRQKLLGLQTKTNYTENKLPITQGATYLRNYGKNDMNKTYHIPKTTYNIKIDVESRSDYAIIGYTVPLEGKYEISITSRGLNIVGSPYTAKVSKNLIRTLEKESSNCENGEEINMIDVDTNKKVVLRIVDFVTEKMLLKENGCLEKISDDEATTLMKTEIRSDNVSDLTFETVDIIPSVTNDSRILQSNRFRTFAKKVINIIKVCKSLKDIYEEKQPSTVKKYTNTFKAVDLDTSSSQLHPVTLQDIRDKIIIPPNISVSIRTEKPSPTNEKDTKESTVTNSNYSNSSSETSPDHLQQYSVLQENDSEEDTVSVNKLSTCGNPFLMNYKTQEELGTYLNTEYETNNSQMEETRPVKILVDNIIPDEREQEYSSNPFLNVNIERPKTPVLKIITGEIERSKTPVYVDPNIEHLIEKVIEEQPFLDPLSIQEHYNSNKSGDHITDFIIGAPVSLPPNITTPSLDTRLESIPCTLENTNTGISLSHYSIRLLDKKSLDSTLQSTDRTASTISTQADKKYQNETAILNRENTLQKETWDSAYVSIDDNNCSPEGLSGDNISYETQSSSNITFKISPEELSNMGPAEKEIWNTELENGQEDLKAHKKEINIFSPIIEENERNISPGMKDLTYPISSAEQEDSVIFAFTELDTACQEISPNPECTSIKITNEDIIKSNNELHIFDKNIVCVNSASELKSDVKRRVKEFEGEISEVQVNVTESSSVSRTLQNQKDKNVSNRDDIDETDTKLENQSNISLVSERKQYFDEQTSDTEITLEENKAHYKRKRTSAKTLKYNDSLTKRKGKQIVKNFLNATVTDNKVELKKRHPLTPQVSTETENEVNLVEKWRQYWDTKLEMEREISNSTNKILKSKPLSIKVRQASYHQRNSDNEGVIELNNVVQTYKAPTKQDIPEEVYKAFETSPKTFFGTSRNQILNKIDSFSAKPCKINKSTTDVSIVCPDSGLVSSRVSLFHSISKVEEPQKCLNSHSMHNSERRNDFTKSYQILNIVPIIDSAKNKVTPQNVKNEKSNVKEDDKLENNPINKIKSSLEDVIEKGKPKLSKERNKQFIHKLHNQSLDESISHNRGHQNEHDKSIEYKYVKKITNEYNERDDSLQSHSKSEMDIFTKVTNNKTLYEYNGGIDKYKSCEDLPKINVKNFISLYESATRQTVRSSTPNLHKKPANIGLNSEADNNPKVTSNFGINDSPVKAKTFEHRRQPDIQEKASTNKERQTSDIIKVTKICGGVNNTDQVLDDHKDAAYLSLSDIDLEIVDKNEYAPKSPKKEFDESNSDYKSRFKMAKQFFQSLEELREVKRPPKLNECQMLLYVNKSTESPEDEKKSRKRFKRIKKSNSMPSSEICKIWNELQEMEKNAASSDNKYIKISEKFNVDDLFTDVMEGKLSRQGSLKGIPHKKAVLATFKSMENISNNKISPYEIAASQVKNFAKENKIKNSQTYLTEYPYLPTTDPSKCYSRFDANASGFISMKEVLRKKPRRNSVPDVTFNPNFTVDL